MSVEPTRLLPGLAEFLHDRRDRIAEEWMVAVLADSENKAAEPLILQELQDHLPQLLDRLLEAIAGGRSLPKMEAESKDNAGEHGIQRWEHECNLSQLVREMNRVREVILGHVLEFSRHTPSFDLPAHDRATRAILRFFDEIIRDSVDQMVARERAVLRERVEQAELSTDVLRQGNEQLQQLDESRLRLLRTVSHELRNLLNAVKLSGEALTEDDNGVTRRRLAVMLYRNVDHMDELLEDLLDFSSLMAGQKVVNLRTFNPEVLLEEVLYAYEPMAEAKELSLEGACDPHLKDLFGDELKIKQIASNLVSNALKYTARGKVSVEFSKMNGSHWGLVVHDTGPGIPGDEIDRIFNEFHRVKDTAHQQGTGLGLAITKRLVDLLGGEIEVHSNPGEGSRFEVRLPLKRAS